MMDEVNNANTLSLRVDITRWRTLKLTHKLSKDITTIWALRLTNEHLMNKLSRNNRTIIWGLCNMFKVDSKLLETSLYSSKMKTSRLGHKRAVRINFCPLRIGFCQCSVARSLFIRAPRTVATGMRLSSSIFEFCYSVYYFSISQKRPNSYIFEFLMTPNDNIA